MGRDIGCVMPVWCRCCHHGVRPPRASGTPIAACVRARALCMLQGAGCGGLFHIMLTTYTLWEREGTSYSLDRAFLSKWNWSHVVGVVRRRRRAGDGQCALHACWCV